MEPLLLQAHRGVSTEYPENTVSAVVGAICQGYTIIEVDPAVTRDGEIVLLHDRTLNRTARRADGRELEEECFVSDVFYRDLSELDFGAWFSRKFKGERIPLLSDILSIAREHDVLIKLDNKFQGFSKESREKLFDIVAQSRARVAFTVNSPEFAELVHRRLPTAELHYDGPVTEELLRHLTQAVGRALSVVWLPYPTARNTWVKLPFVDEELCELVKRYAKLGLWILSTEEEYRDAVARFDPDVIETTGSLKPRVRKGILPDMHTHSRHSHDSRCPISDMAQGEERRGVRLFAVCDHCDVEFYDTQDLVGIIHASLEDAKRIAPALDGIELLRGVEMGEAFWHPETTREILGLARYDVVIGSVHAVKLEGLSEPYSVLDFGALGKEASEAYLAHYFDDVYTMLERTELDILAHLSCPLRYINGKFGLGVDCRQYEDRIERILRFVIRHGIALEINTSCKGSAYDEFMPEEWIVERYHALGGRLVTLGSDAHISEHAGRGFDEALRMLGRIGFPDIFYFKNRYLHQCAIEKG